MPSAEVSVPEILTASIPEILAGLRPSLGLGRRLPLRAKRDARSGGRDARDDEAVRDPGACASGSLPRRPPPSPALSSPRSRSAGRRRDEPGQPPRLALLLAAA